MHIFAIANQKGGVGKTTTAVNLATGLALKGKHVLLIDLDPQANATYALLGPVEPGPTIYHTLIGKADVADVVHPTEQADLDALPADIDLAGAEVDLLSAMGGQTRLRVALGKVNTPYDYVLIDTPPLPRLCASPLLWSRPPTGRMVASDQEPRPGEELWPPSNRRLPASSPCCQQGAGRPARP